MSEPTPQLYRGVWALLVRLFKVPQHPPTLPVAANERRESFKPSLGFLRYLRVSVWFVLATTLAILLPTVLVTAILEPWLGLVLLVLLAPFAAIPVMLSWLAQSLRYDTTWYVMTERSLRLRRGIWTIHEMTVTFENVQNMKIEQGPLQRFFGISNLVIETAGGGAVDPQSGIAPARPIVEGIENPEALRASILARLRQSQSSGLGDDEPSSSAPSPRFSAAHLQVLRELCDEIKALPRADQA